MTGSCGRDWASILERKNYVMNDNFMYENFTFSNIQFSLNFTDSSSAFIALGSEVSYQRIHTVHSSVLYIEPGSRAISSLPPYKCIACKSLLYISPARLLRDTIGHNRTIIILDVIWLRRKRLFLANWSSRIWKIEDTVNITSAVY
jgi:hypothetical protein